MIEESVVEFINTNDLNQRMNTAEANDFHSALKSFQAFLC